MFENDFRKSRVHHSVPSLRSQMAVKELAIVNIVSKAKPLLGIIDSEPEDGGEFMSTLTVDRPILPLASVVVNLNL